MEDFGFCGDGFLLGDCQDDWIMDELDAQADAWQERRQVNHRLAEFGFDDEDEPDELYDIEQPLDDEPYDWMVEQQELEDFEGLEFYDY